MSKWDVSTRYRILFKSSAGEKYVLAVMGGDVAKVREGEVIKGASYAGSAHDDGDFSYMCGSPYCRCCS